MHTCRYTAQVMSTSDQATVLDNLVGASDVLNNLSSFLLSFFVTVVIQRWWNMCQLIQELNSDALYVTQMACTYIEGEQGEDLRDRFMRYVWMANALAVLAQRRDTDLALLHEYGGEEKFAVTKEEYELLRPHTPSMRIFMVTQWLSTTLLHALASDSLLAPRTSLNLMQVAIGGLHSKSSQALLLLDRQLPFSYIHLLTVVVKCTMIFISIEYGFRIGVLWHDHSYALIFVNLTGILLVNFFYQGLLNLHSVLARPWFDHPAHIPRFLILKKLRDDLITIMAMRTRLPRAREIEQLLTAKKKELTSMM